MDAKEKNKTFPIKRLSDELVRMIEKLIFNENPEVPKKHSFTVEFSAKHNEKDIQMSGLVITSGKFRVEPDILDEARTPQGSTDGAAFVEELEKI